MQRNIDIPCSEIKAFNLLLKDSVRMIIASRTLKEEEADYFKSNKIYPKEVKIATDGIAFIVHEENPDTLITTGLIQNILVGKVRFWNELNPGSKLGRIKVVFDNPQSSTAEYAIKEICKNHELSPELSAMESNPEVIDYVSKNPGALGIIGINWISNRKDTTCMGFLEKINVFAVSKEERATVNNSYQPYQAYLATKQYPYTRDLYIILTDPRFGLTSGFTSFIASDRGQRIILKSGILPATQPLRLIHVNDNF
jgi:phosphate transport system substrate-binding protein